MRKLFTLMACAALTAGSAFADIKIGDATYSTLKDAVAAVKDGETILISGEVSCNAKAGDRPTTPAGATFTIEGEGTDAVITCAQRGTTVLLCNQSNSTVNIKNVTFDGGNREWDDKVIFSAEKGTMNFEGVTFKNFTVKMKTAENQAKASQNCIISTKNTGNYTLTNVTFDNCIVAEGFGLAYTNRNNGLTISGNNPGLSIYPDGVAFQANNLTNTTAIDVYLTNIALDKTVVTGYTDLTKFNFIGAAEGCGVEANGSNLVYAKQNYVAMIGNTGYKTISDALNAAVVAVEEGQQTVVSVLDNCQTASRFLPNQKIDFNILVEATGEAKTITRFNGSNNNTMFELNNDCGVSTLTLRNLILKNENTPVTNSMIAIQKGTVVLDKVTAEYATTNGSLINIKETGWLYLTDSQTGNVFVNTNGHLHLAGDNTITIELAAVSGAKFARIQVEGAMTNATPIAISCADMAGYVGKTLVTVAEGVEADPSKFALPAGYEFSAVEGGLAVALTKPGVPALAIDEAAKTVTVTAEEGCTVWYQVNDNPAAAAMQAFSVLTAEETAAIEADDTWTNSGLQEYTVTVENGKNYAFAAVPAGMTPSMTHSDATGVSVSATGVITGVEGVEADADINAPVEYFNLQGQPVANPANGIYIRRQGSKVAKVIIR